jgi:ribosome-associated protein
MRPMSAADDDSRTARQIARSRQRKAGDRSTRLANALMKLGDPAIRKLELEEGLREAVERARKVTSHIARRRAERTLAGDLRRFDLVALADQLAKLNEGANNDVQELHVAERWRARMIEEGVAATAEFPGGSDDVLVRMIDAARRERDTGRPPGAARALFRHIVEALRAQRPEPELESSEGDGDDA